MIEKCGSPFVVWPVSETRRHCLYHWPFVRQFVLPVLGSSTLHVEFRETVEWERESGVFGVQKTRKRIRVSLELRVETQEELGVFRLGVFLVGEARQRCSPSLLGR